jgi:hypothetical protein
MNLLSAGMLHQTSFLPKLSARVYTNNHKPKTQHTPIPRGHFCTFLSLLMRAKVDAIKKGNVEIVDTIKKSQGKCRPGWGNYWGQSRYQAGTGEHLAQWETTSICCRTMLTNPNCAEMASLWGKRIDCQPI